MSKHIKPIMKRSYEVGFSFGLTSGIITTMGLMVGLNAGTGSRLAVIGGILTIAVADAFSDAVGMHISQESEVEHSVKQIWESTLSTFLAKFFFALTFIIPILFFPLSTAVTINIFWGLIALGVFSYIVGKMEGIDPWSAVFEHVVIALLVVIITQLLGKIIAATFS
jgi:VIT1/CCC1 family predicted Fe2+/Mn2+ transporter